MWFHEDTKELLNSLSSSRDGLTSDEARSRLEKYGKNELRSAKKKGFISKFIASLFDRMTVVLMIAAAVSFVTSLVSGEGFADPIIILIIVVANGLIATLQESRAERALEALKRMTMPAVTVMRDGKAVRIRSSELVRGDVFLLEKGDIVPCDARLLDSVELLADESAITGESVAVAKSHTANVSDGCPISEAANCVFTSSHIVAGRARALAVRTGMDSCVGEIAGMISGENEPTPLQKRLARLSGMLGNLTVGICVMIFVFSLIKGMDVGEMFLTSVSLSVAAIPEGLPAIVTVVLSAGVQTMARHRAVVKRLPAVETLGCAEVICSDKTGTLTCNQMRVVKTLGDTERIRLAAALCNNDSSPTELALTEFVGEDAAVYRAEMPRVAEIPFDSAKKYMITLHKTASSYLAVIKGAPDVVSRFCINPDGIAEQTESMAREALRVIALGTARLSEIPADLNKCRFDPVGLCGITDPPRPEAESAVSVCKKAGIRTVMITGDHPDTALAIAKKIGIAHEGDSVCTERELSELNEREFSRTVEKCNVFARVTPAFKLRIVSALRARGYVVAMTGDGVNDAPALKRADIGCAMGISGTEVAKESSDMILTDDNFSTVVEAVKEGRGIYENIRRAVHFLLSCNIGELFTVFFSILASLPTPLSAIQLLWVNLTTDSLPAIALGLEKTPDDAMLHPPVRPDSPLFSGTRIARIIFEGVLIGTLSVTAFSVGCMLRGFTVGRTMCFLVLGISQLFHSFNLRSEHSAFSKKVPSNPFVYLAFVLCLALQSAAVLIPAAAKLFGVSSLSPTEWLISLALSAVPLAASEIYKLFKHK